MVSEPSCRATDPRATELNLARRIQPSTHTMKVADWTTSAANQSMQSDINCLKTKPGLNIVMPLTTTVNRAMREDRETTGTAKAGSSFFDNGWRKRKQLQRRGYALFAVGHTPQQNTTQRSTIQYNTRVDASDRMGGRERKEGLPAPVPVPLAVAKTFPMPMPLKRVQIDRRQSQRHQPVKTRHLLRRPRLLLLVLHGKRLWFWHPELALMKLCSNVIIVACFPA